MLGFLQPTLQHVKGCPRYNSALMEFQFQYPTLNVCKKPYKKYLNNLKHFKISWHFNKTSKYLFQYSIYLFLMGYSSKYLLGTVLSDKDLNSNTSFFQKEFRHLNLLFRFVCRLVMLCSFNFFLLLLFLKITEIRYKALRTHPPGASLA